MKRKITSLTTAIIVLFLILFTLPETGWGQSSYTFSPSSAVFGTDAISQGGTKTYKDGDVTWTLSATAAINYLGYEGSNSARGLQFGSSSATASSFKLSTSSISGTITQIKVNAAMASSGGTKFTVWVGGTQWGSEQSVTTTATAYTFTADEGDATSGTIEIRYTNSKTKASYCKSIEVSYTTGGGAASTTTTISDSGITNTDVYTSTTAGLLSASVTSGGNAVPGATVTWSGNNDDVATINSSTGAVTLVSAGSVKFTASYAGQAGVYQASSAEYNMTVTNSAPYNLVTFDATKDKGTNSSGSGSITKSGVTFSCTSSNLSDGVAYRLYSGSTTTISVSSGTITDIAFTMASGYSASLLSLSTGAAGVYSDGIWIGEASSVSFKASAQSRVTKIVVTVDLTSTVTKPSFSPTGGLYTSAQNVTISSEEGATIYYTTNGTRPTNSSTQYTGAINISSNTTLRTIAYKNNVASNVSTAFYTIVTPLTTMQAIYNDAAANTSEHGVYITFNNWVISGTSLPNNNSISTQAFLTDGTKGCIIYNGEGHSFTTGDMLSGTAQCKLQLYKGYAEITELTSTTSGLIVTPGGIVSMVETTIANLSAVNTGSLVKLTDVTYNGTTLAQGENVITPYTTLYNGAFYTSNKKYDITGVFAYNTDATGNMRINPRNANDIVLKAQMTAPTFNAFTYVVGDTPTAQTAAIAGTDFSGNLTVSVAEGEYVVSNDGSNYGTSATFTKADNGSITSQTLYVKLNSGLSANTYNGKLSFTADYLDAFDVNLEGSVTANPTYNVVLSQPAGEIATIASDPAYAQSGTTITLSYSDVDDCYEFISWSVLYEDTEMHVITPDENNQFSMPAAEVLVSATFTQKKFTVNYSVNGTIESDLVHANITCGNNASLWDEDDLEAASVELPSGFSLVGWSTSAGSTETLSSFTPSEDATLYAVLIPKETGYRLITSANQITEGTYLIGAFGSTTAPDPLTYRLATGGISSGDMTVKETGTSATNGLIGTKPNDACEFILTGNNTEGFTIAKGNDYLGSSKSENRKLAWGSYSSYHWKFIDNPFDENIEGGVYMQSTISTTTYTVSDNATSGNNIIRSYTSNTVGRGFYLFKKIEAVPYIHVYTGNNNASADITISGPTLITGSSVLNMGDHALNNDNPANLIIEDGAQLICDNSVAATFKKTMPTPAAPSTKDEPEDVYGWELISSPVHDDNGSTIEVTNVTNLTTSPYDMFAYDEENSKWLNQKNNGGATGFNTLSNGQGYMYRNNAKELSFVGNTNVADVEVPLTYTDGAGDLKGFHLVGNPYTENITLLNTTLYKGDAVFGLQLSAFYLLNDESNDWSAELGTSDAIANKQGFLIQISEDNDNVPNKIKFSRTARSASKSHGDNIKFTVANSQFEDVTYALFENALPLNKIDHRNPDVPMIYINQNNQDYAVATMTDDTKVFNLNFKAATTGKYTLSYKATGDYNYLHIIDRLTGADVDMLLEGEYSFIGTPKDSENRFIVHLEYMPNYSEDDNDIFAYQSGSDIYVSGSGELQIFDVTGRRVMTTTINGAESISIPAQGVYIFKLNEKVQKIVVR